MIRLFGASKNEIMLTEKLKQISKKPRKIPNKIVDIV